MASANGVNRRVFEVSQEGILPIWWWRMSVITLIVPKVRAGCPSVLKSAHNLLEARLVIKIGLTGSICCGKSTVAKVFRSHNIPVIDADQISRQIVELGTPGLAQVLQTFGSDYALDNGTLNRQKLGDLVFNSPERLQQLNKITHPLIFAETNRWLRKLENNKDPIVVWDCPLLVSISGLANDWRPLIVVQCSETTQLYRLMARNSLTREQAMVRLQSQLATAEQVKMADYVIDTEGSIAQTIQRAQDVLITILLKQIGYIR